MKSERRRRILKSLGVLIAALVLLFAVELGRERLLYRRISRRIESAHALLKPGMTKDEVRRIAGEPHEVARREPDEYWTWTARPFQGALWRRLGLETMRGHYDLIVRFDGQNRITRIFGGVN
ncbi:MAG TPA: outer membrane protein assembly factor BamE [Pyrinomonadaceae bacterium]|jgi:outer membrane protein assembly factor BamE (lipoprotein component of BamABCDE complex)|nr:outer membrane protein assembly factor BamE [Pyrinomonadaceae bacterium]